MQNGVAVTIILRIFAPSMKALNLINRNYKHVYSGWWIVDGDMSAAASCELITNQIINKNKTIMKNLSKNEMNAVMGGGKMTTVHIKIYGSGTTTSKSEKTWYEKAWDTIKSWF